jgi:hypothetical protein
VCAGVGQINDQQPITFTRASAGAVSFGSSISTTGTSFTNFVLQPGIYQFHLSGVGFHPLNVQVVTDSIGAQLSPFSSSFSGPGFVTFWSVPTSSPQSLDIAGGDRLVQVSVPNTMLQFILLQGISGLSGCDLIITQIQ